MGTGGADQKGYATLRFSFSQIGTERSYNVFVRIDNEEQIKATFTLPFTKRELDTEVGTLIANARSGTATDQDRTRAFVPVGATARRPLGERLGEALFTPKVEDLLEKVKTRGNYRIVLDLANEAELLRIPWELLHYGGLDLASQQDSTIVRELLTKRARRARDVNTAALENSAATMTISGKLRMLVVIANPRDDLDVATEKRKIHEALFGEDSRDPGRANELRERVEPYFLEDCTWKALQDELKLHEYHILHFAGHSAARKDGSTVLLFSDGHGGEKHYSGQDIANLLGPRKSLQLVVFNSCEGARTAEDDPFAGFGPKLVEQGKPAVIAMQYEIGDRAAKAFAGELYHSLIRREMPIDAAVAEARLAIMSVRENEFDYEFATPVLFLKEGHADLFRFEPAAAVLDPTKPLVQTELVEPPKPKGPQSRQPWWAIPVAIAVAVMFAFGIVWLASGSGSNDVLSAQQTPAQTAVQLDEVVPPVVGEPVATPSIAPTASTSVVAPPAGDGAELNVAQMPPALGRNLMVLPLDSASDLGDRAVIFSDTLASTLATGAGDDQTRWNVWGPAQLHDEGFDVTETQASVRAAIEAKDFEALDTYLGERKVDVVIFGTLADNTVIDLDVWFRGSADGVAEAGIVGRVDLWTNFPEGTPQAVDRLAQGLPEHGVNLLPFLRGLSAFSNASESDHFNEARGLFEQTRASSVDTEGQATGLHDIAALFIGASDAYIAQTIDTTSGSRYNQLEVARMSFDTAADSSNPEIATRGLIGTAGTLMLGSPCVGGLQPNNVDLAAGQLALAKAKSAVIPPGPHEIEFRLSVLESTISFCQSQADGGDPVQAIVDMNQLVVTFERLPEQVQEGFRFNVAQTYGQRAILNQELNTPASITQAAKDLAHAICWNREFNKKPWRTRIELLEYKADCTGAAPIAAPLTGN